MNPMKPSLIQRVEVLGAGLVVLVLILLPAGACAGPRHHGERHGASERHCVVKALPRHCEVTRVGHRVFYYHRGAFYRKVPAGYLMIQAPIGALVSTPPPGCSLLGSGRSTFYISLGAAYQRHHRGYRVVEPPCRLGPRHPRHRGPRHRHPFSFRGRPGRH